MQQLFQDWLHILSIGMWLRMMCIMTFCDVQKQATMQLPIWIMFASWNVFRSHKNVSWNLVQGLCIWLPIFCLCIGIFWVCIFHEQIHSMTIIIIFSISRKRPKSKLVTVTFWTVIFRFVVCLFVLKKREN